MSETEARFSVLRQSADAKAVAAMETMLAQAPDAQLHRINVIDFAATHGVSVDTAIDAFVRAAKLGLFDMSWNILCPGCGGVLDASASLQMVHPTDYACSLCAAGYEPTLDEVVEAAFTVSPRVRKVGAHEPESLPMWDYVRQMFWSSGIEFPKDEVFSDLIGRVVIDWAEIGPGEKSSMSVQLPEGFIIVFEPVTHAAIFLDVKGEPTRERREIGMVFNKVQSPVGKHELQPGPIRISFENRCGVRVLPALYVAGHELHDMLGRRKRFLTAKEMLTNQTFRDLYGTDTLTLDQRLKVTNMTFVFTDLKASTELYERVGDLAAYDLVKAHFGVVGEAVTGESGAVVKTIGDAVMATFPSPERGLASVLRMRGAMERLNQERGREDLLLKIGIHEGPCLAVTLNDRLDYFGQTVNIAARVQGLASSSSIFATEPVVKHPKAVALLAEHGLEPKAQRYTLRGISDEYTVYEIP
jgi:class 3 adenylate cyclase